MQGMGNNIIDYLNGKGGSSSHIKIDDKDSGISSASSGLTPFFVNGDYNKLENTPVKNLTGKDTTNFIVLSGVGVGNYVLTGYYKKSSSSSLEHLEDSLRLTIVEDLYTRHKVLYFTTIENNESFINKIEYDSFGDILGEKKSYLEGVKWEDF